MPQKSVIRTMLALFAWLFLQNFNVIPKEQAEIGQSYRLRKVVLDAGHGGKDPGCIGVGKTYEKDNTLAIVLALGAKIKANYPDVEVIYTRSTDVFVELKERAAIANRNNADLFISVHCNAISKASTEGAETYVMGLHTAAENLEVAKRENASIFLEDNYRKNYEGYDPNSPEAHILGSVWQGFYLEQSILLAQQIQHFSNKVAKRMDRGVKQAGFLVLRETAMPSILIEAGYMTNKQEDAYLYSEIGRQEIAEAIFLGFEAYKMQMEDKSTARKRSSAEPPKATHSMAEAPAKAGSGYIIHLLSWPSRLDKEAGKMALLTNVREEQTASEYRYFLGTYKSKEEAEKVLSEVKNLGFKTAKVMAR